MVQIGYYPGCSLEGTAKDYRASLETVCGLLDIELQELKDWNCCGATAAHSLDEKLAVQLPGRNLMLAEEQGLDLVVPCALCFNRLKTAEQKLLADRDNHYGMSFGGQIKVRDLLDFLTQPDILDLISARQTTSLSNLKGVCYYGCMANRPPRITSATQWENPGNMDSLLTLMGMKVLDWPFKTDCCGASHSVARPELVYTLVHRLYERALAQGADCIVVSCQMCQANLDLYQDSIAKQYGGNYYLPIFYFTELMALALGVKKRSLKLNRHLVNPKPLLHDSGLL